MSPYIIYGLIDPRNDQLRYIGSSTNGLTRPRSHLYNFARDRNIAKAEWLFSLVKNRLRYDVWVIEECPSARALVEAERSAIELYRWLGCDLLNRGDGGEGLRRLPRKPEPKPKTTLPPYREWKRQQEDKYFTQLGEELGWDTTAMAKASGLHRSHVYAKLSDLGVGLK